MKKIIILFVLAIALVTACTHNSTDVADDTISQPVADDLQGYEDLNKELVSEDLDSLDQDLDFSEI